MASECRRLLDAGSRRRAADSVCGAQALRVGALGSHSARWRFRFRALHSRQRRAPVAARRARPRGPSRRIRSAARTSFAAAATSPSLSPTCPSRCAARGRRWSREGAPDMGSVWAPIQDPNREAALVDLGWRQAALR